VFRLHPAPLHVLPSPQSTLTQRKSVALQAVTQVTQYLRVARLNSIKSRILALAVIGTLLPAGITLGVAYTQSRRALESNITQDLRSQSEQTARAVSVWLKDRIYDLRVFASSEEVLSNVNRYAAQGSTGTGLREYLRSLHERFKEFDRILVVDPNGRVIAAGSANQANVTLPADWQKTLRQQGQAIGDAMWDDSTKKGKLVIAVPIQRADGRVMGAFAAELGLGPLQMLLREYAADSAQSFVEVFLVTDSGTAIASTREVSRALLAKRLAANDLAELSKQETAAMTYVGVNGAEVLGTLTKVPQVPWKVIAEIPSDAALSQVRRFRNLALLVVTLLLVVIAGTAYRLGLIIVRPLERLGEGAAEVAMGGLDVDLPDPGRNDETGALTRVFNEMVARLRQSTREIERTTRELRAKNEELERLSVTDGLTGLTNHRALMQRLSEEALRSQRNKKPFTVIMMDVDHFKSYNDQFGHPAGDVVLKQVAQLLKESTRTVDCVARYGGEEFAALLPETDLGGALEVAERIRARVAGAAFPNRQITLSLGVAEFPKHAPVANEIIEVADNALYTAKRAGRNQAAVPGETRETVTQALPRVKLRKPAKKKTD